MHDGRFYMASYIMLLLENVNVPPWWSRVAGGRPDVRALIVSLSQVGHARVRVTCSVLPPQTSAGTDRLIRKLPNQFKLSTHT